MKSAKYFNKPFALLLPTLLALSVMTTFAQTTEFTYQGKLLDSALPPTANYDFEFRLFAVDTGGTAIITQQRLNVAVAAGLFTVKLDLGANFSGAPRWLEIAVRPAGGGAFTTLAPRQAITSAPYAIRSLNAQAADTATTATTATNAMQLGGVAANQYVLTTDSRLSDARPPTAGSSNYIQNNPLLPQTGSFSINGNGNLGGTLQATGTINTGTQYNLAGNRILSISGTDSLSVGLGAGADNTGDQNTFVGRNAGFANADGFWNSYFGYNAGRNAAFQIGNSFFGAFAGENTMGGGNSFFGKDAGRATTNGSQNSFFGHGAGGGNTGGDYNIFVGDFAGDNNTTGDHNTVIGADANVGSTNLNHATAIGAGAVVSTNNTIVLGRADGSDFVIIPGLLTIPNLAVAGSTQLCRNSFDRVGPCSSSLRYKTNVAPYGGGLSIIHRLRPITFNWKADGKPDVGLGAEEVERVEPLLVTYNKAGEVEGVKYDRISVVLLNAVKEQQAQIRERERQAAVQQQQIDQYRKQLAMQQSEIEALKRLLCGSHPKAGVCRATRRKR